jgi:hypothetical protein
MRTLREPAMADAVCAGLGLLLNLWVHHVSP